MKTPPSDDPLPALRPGERPGAHLPARPRPVRRVRSAAPRQRPRRPPVPHAQCGQVALAHVTGGSVPAVCRAVGHEGPMTFREIRRFLERHTEYLPVIVTGDMLRRGAARLWWRYGGERFFAIVGDLREAPDWRSLSYEAIAAGAFPSPLGHVMVVEGRTLVDWTDGGTRRFQPGDLARFDVALILSTGRRS